MEVIRILAPNPGPFTGPGTNTYLAVADGRCAVIDPGPLSERHLERVVGVVGALEPVGVLVTHTHSDHAPLANPLADRLGVPAAGFGPGPGFRPDVELGEGDALAVGSEELVVLHTPGHSPDHLCYLAGELLFTGDHVMGGSTVVVQDMTAYLESLRRLLDLPLERIHPGHGPDVEEPEREIRRYLEHRLERERQVLASVREGASSIGEVVQVVYGGVEPVLQRLAVFSVLAHLRKLEEEGAVALPDGGPVEISSEAADMLWDVRVRLGSEEAR